MTCKDCIHYDVCLDFEVAEGIPLRYTSNCGRYKDKSRFVKLPCKVGDKLYFVYPEGDISTEVIVDIGIKGFYISTYEDKRYHKRGQFISRSRLGEDCFLTREAAEKSLERME